MKRAAGGSQPTGKKTGASSAAASVEKALKRVSAVANPLSSINDQDVARMLAIEVRRVHSAVEQGLNLAMIGQTMRPVNKQTLKLHQFALMRAESVPVSRRLVSRLRAVEVSQNYTGPEPIW